MFTIFLKGHFETEKQEEFLNKLQEILKETDTVFLGQVQSYKEPDYIDFQKVEEIEDAGESENTTEGTEN